MNFKSIPMVQIFIFFLLGYTLSIILKRYDIVEGNQDRNDIKKQVRQLYKQIEEIDVNHHRDLQSKGISCWMCNMLSDMKANDCNGNAPDCTGLPDSPCPECTDGSDG